MQVSFRSLGTDPEVFAYSQGLLAPPFGYVSGAKGSPQPFGDNVGVLADGAAFEFNTTGGATCKSEWLDMAGGLLAATGRLVSEFGLTVSHDDHCSLSDDQLKLPEFNEMGCVADFDAYTGRRLAPPNIASFGEKRYAGGHLHIVLDVENPTPEGERQFIRFMDRTFGLQDRSCAGRRAYIGAGRFRHVRASKEMLWVEYRTPSNWWLWEPEYHQTVWEAVLNAVCLTNRIHESGGVEDELLGRRVRGAINSCNRAEMARMYKEASGSWK